MSDKETAIARFKELGTFLKEKGFWGDFDVTLGLPGDDATEEQRDLFDSWLQFLDALESLEEE